MPHTLATAGHAVAKPFWHARDTFLASVAATQNSLADKEALVRENSALRDELATLRRESFTARVLARENEELKTMLGRTADKEYLFPATVINDGSYSAYDTFVIDAGAEDGIREHMLVLTPDGIAVGSVHTALDRTAIVTRFSSPTIHTDVVIQATTTVHTMMQGYGGGTMLLTVPRDISIAVGDPVLLPNYASNPIGSIKAIEMNPEDAYQTVYVEHPVNQYELHYVLVDVRHAWEPEAGTADYVTVTGTTTPEEP